MPCYDKSILKLILVKAAILDLLCYLQGGIMAQSNLTAHEVKKINRTKVFQYIYEQRQTSRPDIATALHLSFPTVSQNLVDLEESGLIEKETFWNPPAAAKHNAFYAVPLPVSQLVWKFSVNSSQSV